MISKIAIHNFKSFKKLEFDCAGINLLTGLNSMGKSSVLQAILLLRQSYQKGYLQTKGLNLKGTLVDLGTGKDVLHINADKEEIVFDLHFQDGTDFTEYKWIFGYSTNEENEEYDYFQSDILPILEFPSTLFSKLDSLAIFNTKFQYLNAERWVKNQYERSEFEVIQNRSLGKNGEFTTHYLAHFGPSKNEWVHEDMLYPDTEVRTLEHQVSAWMNEISPGITVNAEKVIGLNVVKLTYNREGDTPTNVGFGITYVLPVVVSLLSSKPGDILLIENPESHIHPKGQSAIGRLIALAAKKGVQIFIETHSEHILNGIRIAVYDELISKKDLNILYFEKNKETPFTKIEVDNKGGISYWPTDFFDQATKDLNYLFGI